MNYTVGVEEVKAFDNATEIHPNPVRDLLRISRLEFGVDEIEISDVMGRKLLDVKQPQFPLNVSTLPEGVFLCRVKSDYKIFSSKFIKE